MNKLMEAQKLYAKKMEDDNNHRKELREQVNGILWSNVKTSAEGGKDYCVVKIDKSLLPLARQWAASHGFSYTAKASARQALEVEFVMSGWGSEVEKQAVNDLYSVFKFFDF